MVVIVAGGTAQVNILLPPVLQAPLPRLTVAARCSQGPFSAPQLRRLAGVVAACLTPEPPHPGHQLGSPQLSTGHPEEKTHMMDYVTLLFQHPSPSYGEMAVTWAV